MWRVSAFGAGEMCHGLDEVDGLAGLLGHVVAMLDLAGGSVLALADDVLAAAVVANAARERRCKGKAARRAAVAAVEGAGGSTGVRRVEFRVGQQDGRIHPVPRSGRERRALERVTCDQR